jgi:hypothetical protein
MNLTRIAPQPQMRAAKEHRDTTSFLCVPCVLSRSILCQENKDLHNCSTDSIQPRNTRSPFNAKTPTRNRSSADWQSAVSRIGNPPRVQRSDVSPTASRRYGRLPTCATEKSA